MTETSRPFSGRTSEGAPGDAGPYSDDQWAQTWATWFGQSQDNRGVLRGVLEELEVVPNAPADSTVIVEPGSAMVQGRWFLNDADKSVPIASNASGSTRIDIVVLQADFTAQTVRIAVVQGTPGAGVPAITQTGLIWEIPLAYLTLASGFTTIAASAITDWRNYANIPSAIGIDVTNSSGATLEQGAVVIWLPAGGQAIDDSTTEGDSRVAGVIESRTLNGAVGRVITNGIVAVMCDEAVAVGDLLEVSTTSGQAQIAVRGGVFARVIAANTGAGTRCLAYLNVGLDDGLPNYDSGWFAVTNSTTYTKAHGLGATPRRVELWHSAVAAPGAGNELVRVTTTKSVSGGGFYTDDGLGTDATNVYATTGAAAGGAAAGVVQSKRRSSDTGYYRMLAWK